MQLDEISRERKLVNHPLLALTFFLVRTTVFGEELEEPYEEQCESPMPPEAIASLSDEVIENHPTHVTLTLFRHPKPSTQAQFGCSLATDISSVAKDRRGIRIGTAAASLIDCPDRKQHHCLDADMGRIHRPFGQIRRTWNDPMRMRKHLPVQKQFQLQLS